MGESINNDWLIWDTRLALIELDGNKYDAVLAENGLGLAAQKRTFKSLNQHQEGVHFIPIEELLNMPPAPKTAAPVSAEPPRTVHNVPLIQRAGQAVKAIAQNIVNVNQRPQEEVVRIMAICGKCELRKSLVTEWCSKCGCALGQKIKNAGTRCPLDTPKWVEFKKEDSLIVTPPESK